MGFVVFLMKTFLQGLIPYELHHRDKYFGQIGRKEIFI